MVRHSQILQTQQQSNTGPVPPPAEWQTDLPVAILNNVLRLTAPNPGVMTGPGTNSYLVGNVHTGYAVIDPGPADADHVQRLWAAARYPNGDGGNIRIVVCTHSHADHAPGAAPLQALCAASAGNRPPILGLASAATARAASSFVPDRAVLHGERLQMAPGGDGANSNSPNDTDTGIPTTDLTHTLQVIYTPGHAANHVCLLLVEDGLLFSGDHVLNGSTTVVDPPDGNMADYIDSLDLLRDLCEEHGVEFILPAHGHVIADASGAIAKLKAHRLQREAKIAAVIQANPQGGPDEWLPLAYDDVHPRIWPVAKRSLLAHIERITYLQTATGKHAP